MRSVQPLPDCTSSALCASCGIPVDARNFDESSVVPAPDPGIEIVLASFSLPAEYCGTLQYFSQFTDLWAANQTQIETPDLEWCIFANRRPIDPYLRWQYIVNPWGYGSFPITVRLDERVLLEFSVRGVAVSSGTTRVTRVGGRLMGSYWYNPAHGDVVRGR